MSVASQRARLIGVVRTVQREWSYVAMGWRDARAREFSERYLDPFVDEINKVLPRLEELEVVMRKVRADCE